MDPKKNGIDIVVGGLAKFTVFEEASKWLGDILWDAYAPTPIETYVKRQDGVFSGVLYAKFASPTDRIKAQNAIKVKLVELGNKDIWANQDLPTEIRAPEAFVSGLKKILVSWGFTPGSVKYEIDSPSKSLKVEGKTVLTVTCPDGELVYQWAEKWENWEELHGSPEMKTLTEKSIKLISGGGKGEGKSKGK